MMMKKYQSLRRKLLLVLMPSLLILIFTVSTILFSFAIVEQRDAFDDALYDSAYSIYQLLDKSNSPIESFVLPKSEKQLLLGDQKDALFYSILDTHGQLLSGDGDLHLNSIKNLVKSNPYFHYDTVNNLPVRVVTTLVKVQRDGQDKVIYIQVAETLHKRQALASHVLIDIIVPQFILLLFAFLIIWFGVEFGLRPLFELQNAVSKRSPLDLSEINLPNVPTEVMLLVNSVNSLMRQLQGVLNTQNRFIADAAHQLRTPIAAAQAQIELTLSDPDPVQQKKMLVEISTSLERLSHTITQLLSLARNQHEAVPNIQLKPIDLKEIAQEVTLQMVPSALKKQIDLGFDSEVTSSMVLGDSSRIKEMIGNLIENAILYTQPHGKVTVSVKREAGEIVLAVEDNGPGIPAEEREKVFDRFYRRMGSGQEGSGLGLAIVKEIAQLHQATIEIVDDVKQQGLNIQISFSEIH
jgi:two-component system, OmpR family, sensor histidine kinase TctE